jgi:hypothetical protein
MPWMRKADKENAPATRRPVDTAIPAAVELGVRGGKNGGQGLR